MGVRAGQSHEQNISALQPFLRSVGSPFPQGLIRNPQVWVPWLPHVCPPQVEHLAPLRWLWLRHPLGSFLYMDFRSTSDCLVPSAILRKIILSGGAIPLLGRSWAFCQAHSLKSPLEAWYKALLLRTSVSSAKVFNPLNVRIFICKTGIIIVPFSKKKKK